ncbi:unnamed protein product [Orchesella dallaii]|uniref:Uncharacterized protein n=1 Tax=Orchesella dallaii TaxID=48710 RepID=A0ABP1RQ23_9HEXA
MGSKTFILCGIFAFVAVALSKPAEKHIIEVVEAIPRPEGYPFLFTPCFDGATEEKCHERSVKVTKEHEKGELAYFERYISGLTQYGKANWKTAHPWAAQRYDQLKASA